MLPLLYFALLLQLGSPPVRLSAIPMGVYSQEADLLNLQIDRTVLQSFPLWDKEAGVLRKARSSFDNDRVTPIIILHLFATWCEPCREEMPIWKELWFTLHNESNGLARAFHIAIQSDVNELPKFIEKVGPRNMPSQLLYFDKSGRLAKNLSQAFDDQSLPPLPITLWLDPDRVVRRVIIGSISGRIPEVKAATMRMVKLFNQQVKAGRRPKAQEEEDDIFYTPP